MEKYFFNIILKYITQFYTIFQYYSKKSYNKIVF